MCNECDVLEEDNVPASMENSKLTDNKEVDTKVVENLKPLENK